MNTRTMLEEMEKHSPEQQSIILQKILEALKSGGYHVAEVDDARPWGGFVRLENSDADRFVEEFFPGLSSHDARLGVDDAPLSPKILYVKPGARLSWQYHNRRTERWRYLSPGAYHRSSNDDQGLERLAVKNDIVQFSASERHRLVASNDDYTLVAEIWQHTTPGDLSDEDDIIRLQDDYRR